MHGEGIHAPTDHSIFRPLFENTRHASGYDSGQGLGLSAADPPLDDPPVLAFGKRASIMARAEPTTAAVVSWAVFPAIAFFTPLAHDMIGSWGGRLVSYSGSAVGGVSGAVALITCTVHRHAFT
jgi:hypothetical protein